VWDRIIGALGVLWGGFVLLSAWRHVGPSGAGVRSPGQIAQIALGVLFVVGGAYFLLRAGRAKPPKA
jgi:hypothetical protein